ncbi:HAMP domain-containing sensor histidine kinase [Nocardioides sp.]|uniref:sensor histidine kinase n=1 Tax=Nocardioides sp. TaxID=35761 RepID=UPI002F3F581B
MRPPSLRARMAATALLVSTLTAAVLVVGLQVILGRSNDATAVSRAQSRAVAAGATVEVSGGRVRVLEERSAVLDQNVWTFDSRRKLLEGRLPQSALARTVGSLSGATTAQQRTVDEVVYVAQPVTRAGRQVATVVAAEDLEPYEKAERHSLWLSVVLGLVTVVFATAAAWVAATRSLRRVQAMADLADDWREHDVGRRFDPGEGGDEIAHLGRTLDQMLDRIVDSLSAERRLTDEIAHEMRTPLAVVLAEADLARQHATDAQREGLDNIHAAAVRMRDSIDTMLSVARAHSSGGDRTTIGQLMGALDLPRTAYDEVVLAAPVAPLAAAVRPLLENAGRHGAGEPRIEVGRDGRTVVISVVDDGPGVAAEDLERVFEPGHTTHGDGSGLGLSLARRMVRAIGGDVVARPGPGGRFEVRVPAR